MKHRVTALYTLFVLLALGLPCYAAAENAIASIGSKSPSYFWETKPVGNAAELSTLICRGCDRYSQPDTNVPLIAVLRDTLGDDNPENDRLTALWLLTYSQPRVAQRIFSAIPFFYWRAGSGSPSTRPGRLSPLMDLTELQHPMVSTVQRNILQWTMLDTSALPIRATSRAYRTNETDHERLHLEEAISYLRQAPRAADSSAMTTTELNTLIARLELRKTLLGGFVTQRAAARIGEEASIKAERVRGRNWEILRQCADKTGLYFEPLEVAGTSGQYALLWFPLAESTEPDSAGLSSIWKLLNIKNPWRDSRLKTTSLPAYSRDLDESGNLLPFGLRGVKTVRLVPLGAYSLSYPTTPLLLVDFRDRLHIRWHEMTQRSINEITAGVIGISHFTNWYYYVAADLYNFVSARHGAATNQSDRLDCYSQFRVALEFDTQLDTRLRYEMQQRVDSLAVNPLETSPRSETAVAVGRYDALSQQAEDGRLLRRIDKTRRAELASDAATKRRTSWDYALHHASFGSYTHRVRSDAMSQSALDSYRRAQYELEFLDHVSANGTQPEVAFDAARIQHAILDLKSVMPAIQSRDLSRRALATLERVKSLSQDSALQGDCSMAIAELRTGRSTGNDQVALSPAVVRTSGSVAGDGLE